MKRGLQLLTLGALVGIALCTAVRAQDELASGQFYFEYDVETGLCDLEAINAPVNDIFTAISEDTGIPIYIDPGDKRLMTVQIYERDIEATINAIASGSTIMWMRDSNTGEEYIEKIITTSSVDVKTKLAQARQGLVQQEHLDKKLAPQPSGPIDYAGIGAKVLHAPKEGGVWLRPLTADSPAAQAGITTGDLVIAIDGRKITDFEHFSEMVEAIRGPVNSSVQLTIRQPDGTIAYKTVTRQRVKYSPPGR